MSLRKPLSLIATSTFAVAGVLVLTLVIAQKDTSGLRAQVLGTPPIQEVPTMTKKTLPWTMPCYEASDLVRCTLFGCNPPSGVAYNQASANMQSCIAFWKEACEGEFGDGGTLTSTDPKMEKVIFNYFPVLEFVWLATNSNTCQ